MISSLFFLLFLLACLPPQTWSNVPTAPEQMDPFPTQIVSAYNGRHSVASAHNGGESLFVGLPNPFFVGRWQPAGGARMNDNEEVSRHFHRYTTTTTQGPGRLVFRPEFQAQGLCKIDI